MTSLARLSKKRRIVNSVWHMLFGLGLLLALIPLMLVVGYVVFRGMPALSYDFFFTDPTGAFFGDQGGIRSAIIGTIEIVALATAIAVPVGITIAVYLNEIGKQSRIATTLRYCVDVLTGVPSIIFGLFIYTLLVVGGIDPGFAAWKGSVALSLLMIPIVARASEVSLAIVPGSLREAALALGVPRWRVTLRIVLPTATPGLLTGSLLAIARATGETAPLIFTVLGAQALVLSMNEPMNSLPLQIFNDVRQPNPDLVTRAWGAALTLILLILFITLIARFVARRAQL